MEQTGSGPDEASRLPAPNLHPVPLIRIRLQSPPPVPSRESGWGCRKQERRTGEVGRGGGREREGVGSCIKILPRKGQLLPSTGLADLPHPPFPGRPGVSHYSLSQAELRLVKNSGALSEPTTGSTWP